jgi:DNA-binding NtrC family response regulator
VRHHAHAGDLHYRLAEVELRFTRLGERHEDLTMRAVVPPPPP